MQVMAHETFPISDKTIFMTDLDGTAMDLLHDPKLRRVDPLLYEAFMRFHARYPNQVMAVTGRDWEQVLDCFEGSPSFPVISSNGAQLHLPDGSTFTHAFSPAEADFIQTMHEEMSAFKRLNPALVTEVKRFEIGFHSTPATGFENLSADVINNMAENCAALVERLLVRAKRMKLDFRIEGTEVTQRCLNHAGINKFTAMEEFAPQLSTLPRGAMWENVVYMGDCLIYGNDREIATKVKKLGGRVVQVINNNVARIPESGDVAEPHYAVATPRDLGVTLTRWIDAIGVPAMPKARRVKASSNTPKGP